MQSQELAIYYHGSIIIFARFSRTSSFNGKPIRPGCLGPRGHNYRSIRAGRSTAHAFRSIRAGNPRAHPFRSIEVDGDDSPLSSASPEVVHLPRWDDLGRFNSLNCNLLHEFIQSFSFKGTLTKPRSSSSSGPHVSGCGQYQPNVCRIWRQRRRRHPQPQTDGHL